MVKQTVMTSVYGVTFVGARKQIQNVLEEKIIKGTAVSGEIVSVGRFVGRLAWKIIKGMEVCGGTW